MSFLLPSELGDDNNLTKWDPTKPVTPVIEIFMFQTPISVCAELRKFLTQDIHGMLKNYKISFGSESRHLKQ